MVERVIVNMKTWRILHTDCRVPKEKIVMVINVVRNLLFFHAPEYPSSLEGEVALKHYNALKQVNLCRSRSSRSLRVQWCYCHYIMTLSDFGQENP